MDYSSRLRDVQLEDIPLLFELCSTILKWLMVHERNSVFLNFYVAS